MVENRSMQSSCELTLVQQPSPLNQTWMQQLLAWVVPFSAWTPHCWTPALFCCTPQLERTFSLFSSEFSPRSLMVRTDLMDSLSLVWSGHGQIDVGRARLSACDKRLRIQINRYSSELTVWHCKLALLCAPTPAFARSQENTIATVFSA